ncbi:4-hydroxy-tetrahydrodipicolinate reductase [Alicyclobacillus sp. SO9]|nr:4-hydroxy-tetrahydrodipicolinate reductase [Alicyclobacillus sp. SO9]
MGREAVKALQADARFAVTSGLVHTIGQAPDLDAFPVYDNLDSLLAETKPDVWLDFTDARSVVENVNQVLTYGVRPVIGATGYTQADLDKWHQLSVDQGLGGIAAPNFAIGALLMMRFAKEAASYFARAEIVELHHDGKKDAPSGTAKRTATIISEQFRETDSSVNEGTASTEKTIADINKMESDNQPARGLLQDDVRVHSVRLPGLVAHQEVLFGGMSETLTIRHDSIHRSSFMPGVLLACAKVRDLTGMVYGLEHILW